MSTKLKVEVNDGDYILEAYEKAPGKLSISIRTDDQEHPQGLEVTTDAKQFLNLLNHILHPNGSK